MQDKKVFILTSYSVKAAALHAFSKLEASQEHPWQVIIQPYKMTRSKAQNALYWMWVDHISTARNLEKDEVHLKLAFKFLPLQQFDKPLKIHGVEIGVFPKSTTKLNTHEFADYLNNIEAFAAQELDLLLPRPDEYYLAALTQEDK